MAPQASVSMALKPEGSLVARAKEASCRRRVLVVVVVVGFGVGVGVVERGRMGNGGGVGW
jgi:hypothetical protein